MIPLSRGLPQHAAKIGRMAKAKLPKPPHKKIVSNAVFPFYSHAPHSRQVHTMPTKISTGRIENLKAENVVFKNLDLKNDPVSMIISGIKIGQLNFREYLISIAEEYFKKRKNKSQIVENFKELLDQDKLQEIGTSVSDFYLAIKERNLDALVQAENTLRDLCNQIFDKALEGTIGWPPLL